MLNRTREFLGRQRIVPWIGEFKETLAQAAFWFTAVNFVMVAGTFYFTTLRYVVPWFTLPMFVTIAVVGILVILVIEYKYITPSIWKFRGKQMDLDMTKKGDKLVAVSGGFDPLNGIGHASHIRDARKLGDRLVVILSRDDQLIAKGNKKAGTFYRSIADRIAIMSELADTVVVNIDKDSTCAETLRLVRPNIFAKGGDRTPSNMPESEILACKEIGCQIVYNVGEPKTTSSSELVSR
jgi:bifunctional ADP-heptose synthase (sugar kinase/adenylyltransferase)